MFLEIVKDCLNLRSAPKEFSLAFSHDLFLLLVVGRRQDMRTKGTSYLFVQWHTSVARIAHGDTGMAINEVRDGPVVMNICTRKDSSA